MSRSRIWPALFVTLVGLGAGCSHSTHPSQAPVQRRAGTSTTTTTALVETPDPSCPRPATSELEECLAAGLGAFDKERVLVAMAVQARATEQPDLTVAGVGSPRRDWVQAESAFLAYRNQSCDAVFDQFVGGTIRGTYEITCEIDLTKDHIEFLRGVLLEDNPDDPGPHIPDLKSRGT